MDNLSQVLELPIGLIGNSILTVQAALIGAVIALVFIFLWLAFWGTGWRNRARQATYELRRKSEEGEARMADVLKSQAELQGRMQTMAELFGSRQAELNTTIGERIDGLSQRIGQNLTEQSQNTQANLTQLQERLAVIDTAQNNIQKLAGDVVQLQHILANKQSRGAFGQSRMEAIIADSLPHNAYAFQPTLSNKSRPDCIIHMPNDAPPLVVDAKFPLEAFEAIRKSAENGVSDMEVRNFRRDIEIHIKAIADKYLIAGETHDTAFMFVPSESIFAEIHEHHDAIVQKAHRARIVIVSPSLLMLSVQVMQSVLKDVRMREQAHMIQTEVIRLLEDIMRLDDRVGKLQNHFSQAQKDVEAIAISSGKVNKRGLKIEALDFADQAPTLPAAPKPQVEKAASSVTGQLKLRVVDDRDEEAR